MLIPYGTDAPVYHLPLGTIGLIATNSAIFFLLHDEQVVHYCLAMGDGLHPMQWVTHMFLHANLAHLLGNMIFLWCFGLVVEGKLGWWKFLPVYLTIGVAVGLIVQLAMLFDSPGRALGASAAISGVMVIACLWAPENAIQLVCIVRNRSYFFEARTLYVGAWYVGWDIFHLSFIQRIGSGPGAHLLGGLLGIGLGLLFLKRRWVDCEGQDVLATNFPESDEAADENVAAALSNEAVSERKRELLAERVEIGRPQVTVFLRQQNVDAAMRLFGKLQEIDPTITWEAGELHAITSQLLRSEREEEAIPFLQELVGRFPETDPSVHLRLAWSLLRHRQRPAEALRVLARIKRHLLDPRQQDFFRRLVHHAKRLQADGIVELSHG